jgi:hypothetical protein
MRVVEALVSSGGHKSSYTSLAIEKENLYGSTSNTETENDIVVTWRVEPL